MDLSNYRTLGHSGLIVSPMALGSMTFGTDRWGASDAGARAIFNNYVECGGNFIDTAEIYSGGASETMLGRFIAERNLRNRLVVGTKFAWNQDSGNPNAGGNGRKNIVRALEGSLARLGTDYVDLYWLHFWDMVTPVEEVLETLVSLVRAGKTRYFALSDVPAWYATKMAVLAAERCLPGPIAIQTEYSLVERTAEQEHVPAARETGMAIMPWSPLAGGFLTGKYRKENSGTTGEGRLAGANPFGDTKFNDRNWAILDALRDVSNKLGCLPADVALAWTLARPGVGSVLVGASRPEQLEANLAALSLSIPEEHLRALDVASALPSAFPYSGFSNGVKRSIFGDTEVEAWR